MIAATRSVVAKLIATLITTLLFTNAASATNGYFSHGYGTQAKGMAGVAAAFPQNSLSAATNPAGIVFLGNRYDIGLALFSPDREFEISGSPSGMPGTFGLTPQSVLSDKRLFAIPNVGANWMVDSLTSVGVSIYGNGGMNTTWPAKVFYGSEPTGVDLSQAFVTATFARQVLPGHSLGVTGIFGYQWFEADGLQAFSDFSTDPSRLTDNGHDNATGFGARIGYLGHITPYLRIGGSFQTKIYMSEFDDYAGLFSGNGDFDVPATWVAGVAVDVTPELTLAADVQQVLYSDIASVGTPFDPADFQKGILLGSDNGPGFGWEDMLALKIGGQYQATPEMAVRAGYSYGEQPIPESEALFNILAPGVMEHHITVGATKRIGRYEISVAGMHAISKSVTGANPMEVPGQQDIELSMKQWEFEIGFGF